MFKNVLSYKGRIRRLEFVSFYLIYGIAAIATIAFFVDELNNRNAIYMLILLSGLTAFLLIQGAKRCHDMDKSGLYQLIPFYLFWMIFVESDYGPNKYGNNPKDEGNYDDINEIGKQIEN
ncbi:MAG: DUF805 domain-containing protein [Algibacter sp.]